jgi:hypothetical protein
MNGYNIGTHANIVRHTKTLSPSYLPTYLPPTYYLLERMVAMRLKDNKGFRGPWGRGKKREGRPICWVMEITKTLKP